MSAAWSTDVVEWEARGTRVVVEGPDLDPTAVFVVDVAPAGADLEPLVVVHGFPTSSFDWAHVVDRMASRRRVVLLDLPGYGLSDKPDAPYTIAASADAVVSVLERLGIDRFAILSHDMGDTVVGELLARNLEGSWPVDVTRRVVTNGSIYIAMAHLTDGQLMLLAQPDERATHGPGPALLAASLVATLASDHHDIDMSTHAELVCRLGGDALLPRTIRYIEERRANESRFTGAIEAHPSALHILWGPHDPIAVSAMAERLHAEVEGSTLRWIDGAGHYPQIEEPERYLDALDAVLS